jgi:hypothetical protein
VIDQGMLGSSWSHSSFMAAYATAVLSTMDGSEGGPRVVDVPKKPTPKVVPVFSESIDEKKRRRKRLRK